MKNLGPISRFLMALATILISPSLLLADTIISVTAPPNLSTEISNISVVSTSWSESKDYTNVSISVLVDAFAFGQTPTANAYLTTQIGPGTSIADQIAQTQFTVPLQLPVCFAGHCAAFVTLFSGLSLGPGNYFLTMAQTMGLNPAGAVGWSPAPNPTVVEDSGVTVGPCFQATAVAAYPPATTFAGSQFSCAPMNFTVTGTPTTPIPEPATATLSGLGLVFVLLARRIIGR